MTATPCSVHNSQVPCNLTYQEAAHKLTQPGSLATLIEHFIVNFTHLRAFVWACMLGPDTLNM